MCDWAGQRPEGGEISIMRSGPRFDLVACWTTMAVQQAYAAGCFCLSQLPLAGFGSVPGSAAPGEWHETTAHPHDREHP